MDKHHVLIVDDEPVICDLLSEDLFELGYLCDIAHDGNTALQKLQSSIFDIVLLDIRLPGMSGIDLLKEIKPKYNVVVIMITAAGDINTAVICMKLGANDYILKPFSLETINTSIKAALEKKEKTAPVAVKSEITALSDEERDIHEMDAIASGIEAKLDLTDKRSAIVSQQTISVARELGIPEERIKQWEAKRTSKDKKNDDTLKKFRKNAIAQTIMGVTEEHQLNNDPNESKN
jgi:DNA-binding response OmpR family regulator